MEERAGKRRPVFPTDGAGQLSKNLKGGEAEESSDNCSTTTYLLSPTLSSIRWRRGREVLPLPGERSCEKIEAALLLPLPSRGGEGRGEGAILCPNQFFHSS